MVREISPARDLKSYLALTRLLQREQPHVILTIGPKAGLIGGLAGATSNIATLIQTKWGLRLETERGSMRLLLAAAEWISGQLADWTFFDGRRAMVKAVELGLVPIQNARLIGNGSSNGIDTDRFSRSAANLASAEAFKQRLSIPRGARLLGFVGRICRDKGLAELNDLWQQLSGRQPELHLAVIGSNECKYANECRWLEQLKCLRNVHLTGPLSGMEAIYPALDVLVVPSHREGFSMVVLEGAAAEVPAVGFDVTGVSDAVVDGKTGLLAQFGNIESLLTNVEIYLRNEALRLAHGAAARKRVLTDFSREQIWECYHQALLEATNGKQ
jgi:glycosyltransferase involved in cell wall biosynthesis